jgi:hypothetical protein
MKIKTFILGMIFLLCISCAKKVYDDSNIQKIDNNIQYKDDNIQYEKIQLTPEEKQIVTDVLNGMHKNYDPEEKMLTHTINGYNYHTDASSGVFHHVHKSFSYAVHLLDLGDPQYTQRAFDVIEKTITLQDQDTKSKSCGVWPYYLEEPLAIKKSPVDYNWADWNAVLLLDVWMGHQYIIPDILKSKIKKALILAANSIQKRNVEPGYTNMAIMGTYVTYMVSHLFNIREMKEYANGRLKRFYDYTLDKGGFTEYNSPAYTPLALDELFRMKLHIIEPVAKQQIESLYSIGWEIIARHYHKPTGQWAGPHSRSYSTLVGGKFYAFLKEASNGKIDLETNVKRSNVRIKHQIPEHLMHCFLTSEYPRTELDVFEKVEPKTIGTCYLTEKYALSTVNRSGLWNQRRPFLVYWGTVQSPKYLQVRLLHDDYDFSSALFFSQQNENKILAGINFISNGGDKHPSIDRLKDGKFVAWDLRLRFEFGNLANSTALFLPAVNNEPFSLNVDDLKFNFHLYFAEFNGLKGHWEKGSDGKKSWIDFVLYSGPETTFDLININRAVMGFTFSIDPKDSVKAEVSEKDGEMNAQWEDLRLNLPVKPFSIDNVWAY